MSDGFRLSKPKIRSVMTKSTRFIVTAAALAGLYAGSMAVRAYADEQAGSGDQSKDSSKHDCKGKNSCKGRAAARPATTAARARTPARARAAAHQQGLIGSAPFLRTLICAAGRWPAAFCFSMPANRFNGNHRLRHRHRAARAALSAHPREEAGRGLVRDHLREFHGRWRPAAGGARPRSWSSTASCSTASRCISAPPTSRTGRTEAAEDAGQADQDAVAVRPSLLGQRRRHLHPRPAAHALYLRGGQAHGGEDPRRCATTSRCRSAWRTSAATPSFTSRR